MYLTYRVNRRQAHDLINFYYVHLNVKNGNGKGRMHFKLNKSLIMNANRKSVKRPQCCNYVLK